MFVSVNPFTSVASAVIWYVPSGQLLSVVSAAVKEPSVFFTPLMSILKAPFTILNITDAISF